MRNLTRTAVAVVAVIMLVGVSIGATDVIVDNDDGSPAYTDTGAWTTSGSTGDNGGTYRYASTGAAKTAAWQAHLPAYYRHHNFPFLGEFDGVIEQVDQNLPQFDRVNPDVPGQISSEFKGEIKTLFGHLDGQQRFYLT